jgi:hypothetical protein
MKDKIRKEAQALAIKEKQLEQQTEMLLKSQHEINRERLLVQNESLKVHSLFLKFSELSHGPEVRE